MSKRQHEVRCQSNPNRCIIPSSKVIIDPTKCSFCNKIFCVKNAVTNHERRCLNNPNRLLEIISIKEHGLRPEKSRLGMLKYYESSENRKIQSDRMKRVAIDNPESYNSSNRGRTKQIIYNNIKFQGSWELIFYKWAEESNVLIERLNIGFSYIWNGERTYFPDFYLPELDLYIEVKGYETDRDRAKWDQFPHKLKIVRKDDINKIKNGQTLQLTDLYK